jgi:branched-chain amino acid transport system permease protein
MIAGQIFNGLIVGSMYALVALGFTLVLGVLHRLNFAHPAVFVSGGFAGLITASYFPSVWLALIAAFLAGGLLGLLIERVSFRRIRSEDAGIAASLSSLALGLLLLDAIHHRWGADPISLALANEFARGGVTLLGVRFIPIQGLILGVTIVLMAALHLLLTRTGAGRRIRAVADSPANAERLGVSVARVVREVFFISGALAAVAGLLFAMRLGTVNSDIGFPIGLKALAVMAIGGMGDLRGAVIGGLLVGLVEAVGTYLGFGRLAELSVWVLMIAILFVRPEGLFGSPLHNRHQRA